MLSPVTRNSEAVFLEKIDSQKIIDLYQKDFNTDVKRYFEGLQSIEILQCRDTGYRFYAPFSTAGDGRFYEDIQAGYANYYRGWKWENQFALKLLSKRMKVLDVGCGKGAFLARIKGKVASCTGLEFNDVAIQKALKNGLDVRKETIEAHAGTHKEAYDAVCMFQVLEHIPEVKPFLNAALQTLKPGGLLIIGVPNSDPWLLKQDKYHTLNLPPHHSGLWNKAVFERLDQFFPMHLEKIGFEPLTAIRHQWSLVLKQKNQLLLAKVVESLPSFVFTILGKTIGRFSKGISMVAVFRKK